MRDGLRVVLRATGGHDCAGVFVTDCLFTGLDVWWVFFVLLFGLIWFGSLFFFDLFCLFCLFVCLLASKRSVGSFVHLHGCAPRL